MPLYSFTTTHPVYHNSVTIDSGKKTREAAFKDLREYCAQHGYPLPPNATHIKREC